MRVTDTHLYFWGGKFSNFYGCTIKYSLSPDMKPVLFNCSEQIFMAHKALYFGDFSALNGIMNNAVPREQKAIGRTIRDFDQDEWSKVSYDFMKRAVREKFSQDQALGLFLLNYADRKFVEASPTDRIWGVGLDEGNDKILNEANWKGTNWLGKILNEIADELAVAKLVKMDDDIQESWMVKDE